LKNRILPAVAITAVLVGLIAVAYSGGYEQGAASHSAPPRVEVSPVVLPRADGGTFDSKELRGKSPVVLNFFATWCPACREELPHLIELYKQHQSEGLKVFAVTTEDSATAMHFAKEVSLPFPILIDSDGAVSLRFQATSIPVTAVLDKQGRAAGMAQGYSTELFDQIESLVGQVLKE
jgi:peroxiredoxin